MSLVGIFACVRRNSESTLFALCYIMPLLYFLGVMIRIMLMITPIVCILAGIGFSVVISRIVRFNFILDYYFYLQRFFGIVFLGIILFFLGVFVYHGNYMAAKAYASPSVVLAASNGVIIDDFRNSYRWLAKNTSPDAKVMSWWDYGYQLAKMSERTTIVDNNTWNTTHIAQVGKAFGANEEDAYKIIKSLDVDYVMVLFGGLIGYSGDDINKFIWILRIAGLDEFKYFSRGRYLVDSQASPAMKESLMYKLNYYRFNEVLGYQGQGYDAVRGVHVTNVITLKHFEEAFTSEHWLIRIYKVLKPKNLIWDQ